MNIFVGNLSFDVTEDEVKQLFQPFGQIATVNLIRDKFTGDSRGFAFVEMATKTEADAAIAGLNSTEFKGRALTVNEARPRTEGGGRRFGGGGGGGGYDGGSRGGGGRGRRDDFRRRY